MIQHFVKYRSKKMATLVVAEVHRRGKGKNIGSKNCRIGKTIKSKRNWKFQDFLQRTKVQKKWRISTIVAVVDITKNITAVGRTDDEQENISEMRQLIFPLSRNFLNNINEIQRVNLSVENFNSRWGSIPIVNETN